MNIDQDIHNGYGFYCDLEELDTNPSPMRAVVKPKIKSPQTKINREWEENPNILQQHPVSFFMMGFIKEPVKYIIVGTVSCISTCILCTWSYK